MNDNATLVIYLKKQGGMVSVDTKLRQEIIAWFKGLMATNELQDDGAGILHQVAQFQVYFIYILYKRPCPYLPTQDPERRGTGS